MSTLAVTLGTVAMLAIGGVRTSLADSNDGGPFNHTPVANETAGSYAPVYSPTTGPRRTKNVKRNLNNSTVDAYDSFGRYLGSVSRRNIR